MDDNRTLVIVLTIYTVALSAMIVASVLIFHFHH